MDDDRRAALRGPAEGPRDADPGSLGAGEMTTGADPVRSDPAASPDPSICPFLRLEDANGALGRPSVQVDQGHRCAARLPAVALAERQQEVVCLQAAHHDCPRYLRGTLVLPVVDPGAPTARRIPRATIGAVGILAVALIVAIASLVRNGEPIVPGGIVSSPTPGSTTAAAASPTPVPSSDASTSPSQRPTAEPSVANPSPPPSSAASPSIAATPVPTSDRYALLEPCPDRPDCYIYTVRAGDNLTSIGLYFGVPFDTVLRLNPWIKNPAIIRKGDRIVLPPPTR